ncbi:MAG: hypothetical protein KDK44_02915 [Chlamydiia bacterium]|nr:hypothetical protein [Chlamydiia bacterium]
MKNHDKHPFMLNDKFPLHIEPAKKPLLHCLEKNKIQFEDPAQLMILSRIIDQSITNPSSAFSPEQVHKLEQFFTAAQAIGNDITELSLFFKEHMPVEFPIINTKGALIGVINDTARAVKSEPSVPEISAIAQLFRALAAICLTCGFTRAIESVAKELDVASTLWEEGAIQSDNILQVINHLKKLLEL